MSFFQTPQARKKIAALEGAIHQALLGRGELVPELPARDVTGLSFQAMPPKSGLITATGRARLLHDLANIELQAMELAYRGLIDFPEAPEAFRQELAALALSEGEHLKLCLDGIEELGHRWGDWPVHFGLWRAVRAEDSLLDRVLIVHRYLEASGLDAGAKLLARLRGLNCRDAAQFAVERIHREEIGHVDFGSRWYRELCRGEGLDPDVDFRERMQNLRWVLPYRTEVLDRPSRRLAGFSENEIDFIESWRQQIRPSPSHKSGSRPPSS